MKGSYGGLITLGIAICLLFFVEFVIAPTKKYTSKLKNPRRKVRGKNGKRDKKNVNRKKVAK